MVFEEAKLCTRLAFEYEVDESGLLLFYLQLTEYPDRRVEIFSLVPTDQIYDRETAQVVRRPAHQESPLDKGDSGKEPKHTRDRVKNFHCIRSHV